MDAEHWHVAHHPRGPLARYARRLVAYGMAGGQPGTHLGMPSGALTLVVSLDEPLRLTDPGRAETTSRETCLAGLDTRATVIHHDGSWRGVQLDLRPSAPRAFFGVPAGELARSSVELAEVLGATADRLRDRLQDATSPQDALRLVDAAFDRPTDGGRARPEVAEAWRLIGVRGGRVRVAEVARHVGWSVRHLEQELSREVGLRPSEVVRLRRFESAHRLVRDPAIRLADVASRCGYADQAHLAREWRTFTGESPSSWRRRELAYVQAIDTDLALPSSP